jgi:LmbE family N-acetylglucosaminyl deacetylase
MAEYPKSVLVCTPHPDDAEIGCGGTIAKWVRDGVQVVYIVTTNGDKGSSDPEMTSPRLAAIREQEQLEAARTLGVREVIFLRYADGFLEDTAEFRGKIVREIRRFQPDIVLTTDPLRRSFYLHRDHRVTGQVTLDAVFPSARDHLCYPEHMKEGLTPHKTAEAYLWGSDEPDTFVDISDVIDLKIKALACHKSQVPGLTEDNGRFVREMSKRWGEKANAEYAEAFRVIKFRR